MPQIQNGLTIICFLKFKSAISASSASKKSIQDPLKIDPKFRLREIAGEHILVNQGVMGVSLTRVISLNESAVLLFNQLVGKDFTPEDAARILGET